MSAPTRPHVDAAIKRLTDEVAAAAYGGQATGALFCSTVALAALLDSLYVKLAQSPTKISKMTPIESVVYIVYERDYDTNVVLGVFESREEAETFRTETEIHASKHTNDAGIIVNDCGYAIETHVISPALTVLIDNDAHVVWTAVAAVYYDDIIRTPRIQLDYIQHTINDSSDENEIKAKWGDMLEETGATPEEARDKLLVRIEEWYVQNASKKIPSVKESPLTQCASDRDGDCTDTQCPQTRDGEPEASGRSCPLYNWGDNEC